MAEGSGLSIIGGMTSPPVLPAPETVALRDGTEAIVRPIRPDDAPRLQALHARLSPESIYLRFLSLHPVLSPAEVERLANVDYRSRMAFVAAREEKGETRLLGVARYDAAGPGRPDEAEAAIVIEDAYQGQGLGTILIDRLLAYAQAHGIRAFTAEINADNDRILHFVRRSGLPAEKRLREGVWEVRVRLL